MSEVVPTSKCTKFSFDVIVIRLNVEKLFFGITLRLQSTKGRNKNIVVKGDLKGKEPLIWKVSEKKHF